MRNSLFSLVPYDEATLFDLVLYDYDEATLSNELPDAALEVAAGKHWEIGNPFTIALCSGLDTCPAAG
jgi:hypothetical protein